jgi:hypothetical protein
VDDPFATDRLNGVDDFRPEWDVPALGAGFTAAFSANERIRESPDTSSGNRRCRDRPRT